MKGKRVLLVNPWIYDFAAYDLWAKPLGLLYLGSLLKLNGCEVSFVDCLKAPHEQMSGKPPKVHPGGRGKFYRQIVDSPAPLKGFHRRYGRYGISREAFFHDLELIEEPNAVLITSGMTYWYPGVHETIT
ncbi:MAG TPA: radical SAM protein, partial [Desulfomonilia bacterium]|nr:radical SAM protein [Desulfomonilia bacterium]